jgi:AbiU2
MPPHSKEVVEQFCNLCDWLRQSWQTRKYLFDENPKIENLKAPHYAHFFFRLNVILQEYWIQQVAKLHDPAVQLGHQNLSINYMVDCGQWDAKTKAELINLRDKMMTFEKKLRGARNKLLSHNDLTTILQAPELGGLIKETTPRRLIPLSQVGQYVV